MKIALKYLNIEWVKVESMIPVPKWHPYYWTSICRMQVTGVIPVVGEEKLFNFALTGKELNYK